MPIYPFRCDGCTAEFEISRKISAMRDPAPCPACGQEARRVFTAVAVTGNAVDPAVARKAAADAKQKAQWSHFGHSHGPGSSAHSHGTPMRPPPGTVPAPGGANEPANSRLDRLADTVKVPDSTPLSGAAKSAKPPAP